MTLHHLSGRISYPGLFLLILTLLGAYGGAYAATYQYEISAGDYALEKTEEGVRPQMAGFGQLMIPGKPVLPSRVFNIAVPPNSRVINVSVQASPPIPIKGRHGVAPAGLGLPIGF